MKKKTYKPGEWAVMIAVAIFAVAGIFFLLGLSPFGSTGIPPVFCFFP